MKSFALVFAVAVAPLAACNVEAKDSPACKQLREHIFRISPESQPQLAGLSEPEQRKVLDQLNTKVPAEDIDQCTAADPKVVACMQAAPDMAALRACIPAPK